MVFSSVPLYLDPPNWQQHPNHHHHHQQQQQQQVLHHGVNQGNENHLIQSTNIQPPHSHMGGGPGGAPPIRPNSMAERARLAKIPPPEAPLKCPRCDSTNTKFCYFNNYSLSQPRHFCKTCRRYWTRGGALRNVPVGGGCRRNKRSSSKSSTGGSGGGGGGMSTSSSKPSISSPTAGVGLGGGMDMVGTTGVVPTISGIPTAAGGGGMTSFMASLQNMAQLGMGNLGLTFGGSLHAPHALSDHHHQHPQLDFNVSGLLNQHAPHVHFPSALGGAFDLPPAPAPGAGGGSTNLYSSFSTDEVVGRGGGGGGNDNDDNHQQQQMNDNNNNLPKSCSSTIMSQLAPVKMEGQGQRLNLVKQLMMGISSTTSSENNSNQFWGSGIVGNTSGGITNMWTDLSGLNSSSTSHLM